MKDFLKRFYLKNKITLGLIAFSIIALLLTIFLLSVFIISKPEAIVSFVETSTVTQEIMPFSILSIIAIILGIFLSILIAFLFIKTIFPSKKTIETIMMKDEVDFLIDLPNQLRKEVFKDGE